MKVPQYIRRKMHRLAALSHQAAKLSREIDKWFEERGFDAEDLRKGDGNSLEELEYGTDVTDSFCETIESMSCKENRYDKD